MTAQREQPAQTRAKAKSESRTATTKSYNAKQCSFEPVSVYLWCLWACPRSPPSMRAFASVLGRLALYVEASDTATTSCKVPGRRKARGSRSGAWLKSHDGGCHVTRVLRSNLDAESMGLSASCMPHRRRK